MANPKLIDPPEKIYLQVGDLDRDAKWAECDEVTWCEDKIWPTDIEYRLVRRRSAKRKPK